MNKICTSIEQSKKLIELGINVNSADMHWQYIEEDNGQLQWFYFPKDFSINKNESIPAWSLSALLKLIPITCVLSICNGHYSSGHYRIVNNKTHTFFYNNPLDAAFEMICWLKENNKL